jgi:hypothetical protein
VGGDGRCICAVFSFEFGVYCLFCIVCVCLDENTEPREGQGVTRHVLCWLPLEYFVLVVADFVWQVDWCIALGCGDRC